MNYPIIPWTCVLRFQKHYTAEVEKTQRYGQAFYTFMKADQSPAFKIWWDLLYNADTSSAKNMVLEVTDWDN